MTLLTSPAWGDRPIPNRPRRGRLPANVVALARVPRLQVGDLCELCRGAVPANHGKRVRILRFDAKGIADVESLNGLLVVINTDTGKVIGQYYGCRIHPDNLRRIARPSLEEHRHAC